MSSPSADPNMKNYRSVGSEDAGEHGEFMRRHLMVEFCGTWLPLQRENIERYGRGFSEEEKRRYSEKLTGDIRNPNWSICLDQPVDSGRYTIEYRALDSPYTYAERVRKHEVPPVPEVIRITGMSFTYNSYSNKWKEVHEILKCVHILGRWELC